MQTIALIATLPLLVYAWAMVNPEDACALVAELTRRWRLHIIQKYGEKAAKEFFRKLRVRAAKQGFDKRMVEGVINDYREEIIERLGTKEANARLGEPTPLERYY